MEIDARQALAEIAVDTKNLYREDTFTDFKIATLKQMTPVNLDGSRDLSRPMAYLAQTQLMSQMGPLPVSAQIEADNLEEAIEKFPEAIRVAVDAMIEEVKELQRKEMSKIVVPGAEATSKILTGG